MSKEFEWPFEISGFGGGYEQACRDMTKAGVLWLRKHPEELAKWRDGRKVALFRAPTLIGKID